MIQIPQSDKGFESLKKFVEGAENIESIFVFDYIPPRMKKWLEEHAEANGYHLGFGDHPIRIEIRTEADVERAKQKAEEDYRAHQDWLNSPG